MPGWQERRAGQSLREGKIGILDPPPPCQACLRSPISPNRHDVTAPYPPRRGSWSAKRVCGHQASSASVPPPQEAISVLR